jgi:hypothetical protein
MSKPHYECASRSARQRVEHLTEDQKRKVRSLVDSGQFEKAKKSQQLNLAECVFGFRYEAERSRAHRSAPRTATATPAAPAVNEDAEQERRRRLALAALA